MCKCKILIRVFQLPFYLISIKISCSFSLSATYLFVFALAALLFSSNDAHFTLEWEPRWIARNNNEKKVSKTKFKQYSEKCWCRRGKPMRKLIKYFRTRIYSCKEKESEREENRKGEREKRKREDERDCDLWSVGNFRSSKTYGSNLKLLILLYAYSVLWQMTALPQSCEGKCSGLLLLLWKHNFKHCNFDKFGVRAH